MNSNHRASCSSRQPSHSTAFRALQNSLLGPDADLNPENALLVRTTFQMALERTVAADALEELHQLLESYAPDWYTFEQHERLESALRLLGRV